MDKIESNSEAYCAGYELNNWRCESYAENLMDWIVDYALKADELSTLTSANPYTRLKEAAVRIYSSKNYEKRGEIGEITLHAICRRFFNTIPLAPRVFYLTSSNEVVKSFDMAHVKYLSNGDFELWLGEAKFFQDSSKAIASAIKSVKGHIDAGFLKREKLILGPQISKKIPYHNKIREVFSNNTSLDELFTKSSFPMLIAANSKAVLDHNQHCSDYTNKVRDELLTLAEEVKKSGLPNEITVHLIYIPLASKADLAKRFDVRLKGLLT